MTTLTAKGKEALDARIEQAIKDKNLPSLTLGISNIDGEIYFNGGGPQVVNDPGSGEVNPESVFWICSQTKMIASLALLKLVELGQVSYDTQVGDYLPQLRNPIIIKSRKEFDPCKTPITVKHLLNFSSGLFYPASAEGPQALPVGYTDKDMHVAEDPIAQFFRLVQRNLPGVPVKFEPGTDFVYGWSADIMGFLVEKVTKQTFEQFCKEHIFGPLNMDTSFRLTPELRRRLVHLAYRNPNSNGLDSFTTQMSIMEQDPSKVGLYLGGVGLYSSMRDYLKLLRHLMRINAGLHVPNPILSTRTVREIIRSLTPTTIIEGFSHALGSQRGLHRNTQAVSCHTRGSTRSRKTARTPARDWCAPLVKELKMAIAVHHPASRVTGM